MRTITFIALLLLFIPGNVHAQEGADSCQIIDLIKQGDKFTFSIPDSAIFFYRQALDQSKELGYITLEIDANFGLAKSNYIRGNYNQSYIYFELGLKTAEEINLIEKIIFGLNGCGIALTMIGQAESAIINHKKALKLCQKNNDFQQFAKNLFNISISFDKLKQYDSSLFYVDSAVSLAIKYDSINIISQYRNHQAQLLIVAKEYHRAIDIYKDLLGDEKFTNQWEIQFAKAGMAKALLGLGQPTDALDFAIDANQMAREINSMWDIQQVSKTLSDIYASLANFEKAYEYHQLYKSYSDSLFSQAKEQEINFHLLQEEQLKSAQLEMENAQYAKDLKSKNRMIVGIGLIALLIVLISTAIYRLYRAKEGLLRLSKENAVLIEKQNLELISSHETKDKLFRIIAHDLRTPIGVMHEFTDLMVENLDHYDPDTLRKQLTQLNKSSGQGLELLNNLLDWARSQTVGFPYNPQEIQLSRAIQNTIELIDTQADLKNINLISNISTELRIYADIEMLNIVNRNLLSNAIKYSYPGGEIHIDARQSNDETTICVRDFGVGIPVDQHQRLFRMSQRDSQPGTKNEKGTGLGLILCQDFIDKHQGKIWIDSSIDQGSLFCFTIPMNRLT